MLKSDISGAVKLRTLPHRADMIGRLYKVDIELLYDSKGLPVIRPMRQSA